MYVVEDAGGDQCVTHVMRSTYYAVSIDRLLNLMGQASFERAERLDGRFYQPVLVATKPS